MSACVYSFFVAVCVVCVCTNVCCILECLSVYMCAGLAAPATQARMLPSWLACVLYVLMYMHVTVDTCTGF